MKTNNLTVKDLVVTGVFSALYMIFMMVGSIFFAPNPVLTFLMPPASALLPGPIYLLLIAKVQKKGSVTILGLLMGIITFITGMHWTMPAGYVVFGFIADNIANVGKYKSKVQNLISYLVLSLSTVGPYVMLWVNQKAFVNYLVSKGTGQEYMDTMINTMQNWMLPAIIVGTFATAFISCKVGESLLKKQFEKAGITQ